MIITSAQYFKQRPNKIISLVPSQTELLFHLGLEEEVIGITKFCFHPQKWFKTKTRVGGTKTINIDLIKNLQPDLVIANKEENVKEHVEELANEFDIWVTDVNTLNDALQMINDISELTHKRNEALTLIKQIKSNFYQLHIHDKKIGAAYLIWQKPFMAVGGDTFISNMMEHCGLQNIFKNKNRYPEITLEELATNRCQMILLSSEPYPFNQNNLNELQLCLPGKKIILVDGEMFSWYGSRLLLAPEYFRDIWKVIVQQVAEPRGFP
jgi:ABC-type Fe3+-hydroxamate transport system substrate-binding protein